MQETQVRSLGQEDSLEKGMKIHFSLAWRISWTEEPGVLQSMGVTKELNMTGQLNNKKKKRYTSKKFLVL